MPRRLSSRAADFAAQFADLLADKRETDQAPRKRSGPEGSVAEADARVARVQ